MNSLLEHSIHRSLLSLFFFFFLVALSNFVFCGRCGWLETEGGSGCEGPSVTDCDRCLRSCSILPFTQAPSLKVTNNWKSPRNEFPLVSCFFRFLSKYLDFGKLIEFP
jgi:hypothetical protein